MFLTIPQRPTYFRRIGFRPPAVQFRQVDAAVDEHLHAAGAACLPRASRRVEPDIHSLHQLLGQQHVVVSEEYHMGAGLRPPDEMRPFLDQGLACLVRRMSLAGHDELHRALEDWSTGAAAARGRAATGSVFCRSQSGVQSPVSNVLGSNRCFAPSTASGVAPDAASCLDNRSRAYSTNAVRAAVRNCQSLESEMRRMSCSRASVVPNHRSLPQASVQSSSAAAESQLGM